MTKMGEKILVIQMTRLGDVLQSTPLLRALHSAHPRCEVVALCRTGLASIMRGLASVDRLIVFPDDDLRKKVLNDEPASVMKAYGEVRSLIESLRAEHFDMVINITHNPLSGIICRALDAPSSIGLTFTTDWKRIIKGNWCNYFFNVVCNRLANSLNQVDIYKHFCEPQVQQFLPLEFDYPVELDAWVEQYLLEKGVKHGDTSPLIVFQPGASDFHKQWEPEKFAELGKLLVRRLNAKILILGTRSEAALGKQIVDLIGEGAIDTCGETSLEQAAALLKRAACLVTNDTGIMHVACASGCPVIVISFAMVYFWETGPYGPGHIVVQAEYPCVPCAPSYRCPNQLCRKAISPEHVLRAVELAVERGAVSEFVQLEDDQGFSSVSLYQSCIEQDGFVTYMPLLRRPLSMTDLLRKTYRTLWKRVLNGGEEAIDFTLLREYYALDSADALVEGIESSLACIDECLELVVRARTVLDSMKTALQQETRRFVLIAEYTRQLKMCAKELRVHCRLHESLQPLYSLFELEQANLEQAAPDVLLHQTTDSYDRLHQHALILRHLMTNALKALKPAAIEECL